MVENAFINMAIAVSDKSTCIKEQVGAVIVKDNRVLSIGWSTYPKSILDCTLSKECIIDGVNRQSCLLIAAEYIAMMNSQESMEDSTMYVMSINPETGGVNTDYNIKPDIMNLIYHVGIKSVVLIQEGEIKEILLEDIHKDIYKKEAGRNDIIWNLIIKQEPNLLITKVGEYYHIMHNISVIKNAFENSEEIDLSGNEMILIQRICDKIDDHKYIQYLRLKLNDLDRMPSGNPSDVLLYSIHDMLYTNDDITEDQVKNKIDALFI